jgi:multiple antibiotic resistance protein
MQEILFDTISLITILNPLAAAAIMLSLVKYSEIKEVSFKASLAVFIASTITMLDGLKILTRIMGLIIGAIAFLFLIGGIKALWLMP